MLTSWIVLSLSALAAAVSPTAAPEWESDYGAALEQAQNDDRPLLVVIDDPSDAAKSLSPELLDPTSGAFPLESYDLCRVDASTEYGRRVAEAFRVTSLPHVAIIDKTGRVILTRVRGEVSVDAWKQTLARHESGERRSGRAYTVAKPVVEGATAQPAAYTLPAEVVQPSSYCPSCQRR